MSQYFEYRILFKCRNDIVDMRIAYDYLFDIDYSRLLSKAHYILCIAQLIIIVRQK